MVCYCFFFLIPQTLTTMVKHSYYPSLACAELIHPRRTFWLQLPKPPTTSALWLQFQTTPSRAHRQWCQWQYQCIGVALKQREERTTETGRLKTKSEWERTRWAKGAKDDACAICQNAATCLEEVLEQIAVARHTSTPYALQVRSAR